MNKISFMGPYKLAGDPLIFEKIENINGVYLWCVKGSDCVYRVYYVGESQDIKARMYDHLKKHLNGMYTCHCMESLKSNIKILMHRAGEGMIPRFSHLDASEFNKKFVEDLYIFCAELPVNGDTRTNKELRCRFETGISHQIENGGSNILSVGHLRYWKQEKMKVYIDTAPSFIEYLSEQTIDV